MKKLLIAVVILLSSSVSALEPGGLHLPGDIGSGGCPTCSEFFPMLEEASLNGLSNVPGAGLSGGPRPPTL